MQQREHRPESCLRATRSFSISVSDSSASPTGSNSVSDSLTENPPLDVTALYVKGSSWTASFDNYLGSHSLGNASTPSLGFARQTGSSQTKVLPWVNVNVIEATFNEAPSQTQAQIQSSLILSGGTGGSAGYLNPKRGKQPARFKTIIQIVPAGPS